VQVDGKQINLGPQRDEAFRRYHAIMSGQANPLSRTATAQTTSETLIGLIEQFLTWTQKNKSPDSYEIYVRILSSFAKTLPQSFVAMQIKPFHIDDWVDTHPKWSSGMKRKAITAVQRVYNWAWKQGRIDVTPLRHIEKPPAGRRKLILTEPQFEEMLGLVKGTRPTPTHTTCVSEWTSMPAACGWTISNVVFAIRPP
jgi:integrase/recombinase XerD